jgi:hypothetical protein
MAIFSFIEQTAFILSIIFNSEQNENNTNVNKKISPKLERKVRMAIDLLRLHPFLQPRISKSGIENRSFRCYHHIRKRKFYIIVYDKSLLESNQNPYHYIVDLKYHRCYRIGKKQIKNIDGDIFHEKDEKSI